MNVRTINIAENDSEDGFTEKELSSLKKSLKEAALIKTGDLKPLSMDDLWRGEVDHGS